MSELKAKLLLDFKEAMLNKQQIRKDCIQVCRAAVLQQEKDKQIILDDDGVITVLQKELKKRQDALELTQEARVEYKNKLEEEIKIISSYLPAKIDREELVKIISAKISELNVTSKKQIGLLMKELMPILKNKADGRQIQEVISELLD